MTERITDGRRARRLARVLFSDLIAYSGDQVRLGLEKDDLFHRIGHEITRARVFYDGRVDASIPDAGRIFDWALVDVLIYGNRRVGTYIW